MNNSCVNRYSSRPKSKTQTNRTQHQRNAVQNFCTVSVEIRQYKDAVEEEHSVIEAASHNKEGLGFEFEFGLEMESRSTRHRSHHGPLHLYGDDTNDASFSYKHDHFHYVDYSRKTTTKTKPSTSQRFDETHTHSHSHSRPYLSEYEYPYSDPYYSSKQRDDEEQETNRQKIFPTRNNSINNINNHNNKFNHDDSRDDVLARRETNFQSHSNSSNNNNFIRNTSSTRINDSRDDETATLLAMDEKAIEAEAAEEVAYIMTLSKSNHYGIVYPRLQEQNERDGNKIGNENKDETEDGTEDKNEDGTEDETKTERDEMETLEYGPQEHHESPTTPGEIPPSDHGSLREDDKSNQFRHDDDNNGNSFGTRESKLNSEPIDAEPFANSTTLQTEEPRRIRSRSPDRAAFVREDLRGDYCADETNGGGGNSDKTSYAFERLRHNRMVQQEERNKQSLSRLRSEFRRSSQRNPSCHHKTDAFDSTLLHHNEEIGNKDGGHDDDMVCWKESDVDEALYRQVEREEESPVFFDRDERNDTTEKVRYREELNRDDRDERDSNMHEIRNQQYGGVGIKADSRDTDSLMSELEASMRDGGRYLNPHLPQQQDRYQPNPSYYSVDNNRYEPNIIRHGKETSSEVNSDIEQGIKQQGSPNTIKSRGDSLRSVSHYRNAIQAGAKKEEGDDSDPAEAVVVAENILIDLIHRGKFNFALQRAHYFPDETFIQVSGATRNLALHELISGMVLLFDGDSKERNYSVEDDVEQLESNLLWSLLETNPKALSTQGKGGYLPLHIACSSSFRGNSFQTRLRLIRAMLVIHPESATHNINETGELPLHVAIRWICRRDNDGGGGGDDVKYVDDEPIAMFLLMAYPEGATIRDHSGLTPHDILKIATSREGEQQQHDDQGNRHSFSGGSVVQRLKGYLSFASQLAQISNENDETEQQQQPRKDRLDSTECTELEFAEESETESFGETREPCVERDWSPMDHLEFADTMSGTDVLVGESGCDVSGAAAVSERFSRTPYPTAATNRGGNDQDSMELVEFGIAKKETERTEGRKPPSRIRVQFDDLVHRGDMFEKPRDGGEATSIQGSRIISVAFSESESEDDGFPETSARHYHKVQRRNRGKRTKVERNKMDDAFADDLLNELLDPFDDPVRTFHKASLSTRIPNAS